MSLDRAQLFMFTKLFKGEILYCNIFYLTNWVWLNQDVRDIVPTTLINDMLLILRQQTLSCIINHIDKVIRSHYCTAIKLDNACNGYLHLSYPFPALTLWPTQVLSRHCYVLPRQSVR